jgi:hypothetical protein
MHCIQLACQQGMHFRQLALLESEVRVRVSCFFLCSLWREKKKPALKMEAVNNTERQCLATSKHGATAYKEAIIFSFNNLSFSLFIIFFVFFLFPLLRMYNHFGGHFPCQFYFYISFT